MAFDIPAERRRARAERALKKKKARAALLGSMTPDEHAAFVIAERARLDEQIAALIGAAGMAPAANTRPRWTDRQSEREPE